MPSFKKQRSFILLTIFFDLFALLLSFFAAYLVRWVGFIPYTHMPKLTDYMQPLIVIIPIYLWAFHSLGLYDARRHIRRIEEIFIVFKGVSYSIIVLMALTFFYRELSYSRLYLILLWILSMTFVGISRYLLIQWEYFRRKTQKDISKILLVGGNRNARNIIRWAKENPHYGQEVIGVLARDASLVGKHVEAVPILGVVHQCESFIEHLTPHEVVLLENSFSRERIGELVAFCEDKWIEFKIGADFYGLLTRHVDVEYLSSVPLLGFKALPLDDVWNRLAKRIFDMGCSVLILIFTFPFWFLVILLILWDDGWPVFYVQERIGRDQKVFKLFKFRTMKVDAEKATGPIWARPNDPRRTRVGNFLRHWNLDELPQLWNVLRGDMSLVGPRPERPHFVNQFRETLPRYMARHKIKSGLTGWAQVNGFRGNTSIEERLKYDLYYMENWSLLFDIEILFMTLFAFKNAY